MPLDHRFSLRGRSALAVPLVALPLLLVGCADQGVCAGDEPAAETDYFTSQEFLDETVTVCSEVGELLTPTSFVFRTGDDTVLVVSALETPDIDVGDELQVTGVVRQFTYGAYADEFELGDAERYATFEGEQFLVAKSVNENYTHDQR